MNPSSSSHMKDFENLFSTEEVVLLDNTGTTNDIPQDSVMLEGS